jgi:hypothetical protein
MKKSGVLCFLKSVMTNLPGVNTRISAGPKVSRDDIPEISRLSVSGCGVAGRQYASAPIRALRKPKAPPIGELHARKIDETGQEKGFCYGLEKAGAGKVVNRS